MKHMGLLLAGAVLALNCSLFSAQEAESVGHAPDADSYERLINIMIPALAHAPFTSVVTAEWTKTLEDGSTLTRQNHRVVVRDGTGRIFQERRTLVPKGGDVEPRVFRTEISDPAKHTKYFCRTEEHMCVLQNYEAPTAEVDEPAGVSAGGKMELIREDLGKSNVSGVDVVGSRETRTIAAGVIGNDRPVSITKEFWYSPQLGLNMMVKRIDPRVGTQIFTVTEVGLAEPDPKYFELPAGYTVKDMREEAAKGNGHP